MTRRILNFGVRFLSNRSGDEHAGGGTCADGVLRGAEDALCEPRDGGPRHQDVQHVSLSGKTTNSRPMAKLYTESINHWVHRECYLMFKLKRQRSKKKIAFALI